MTKFLDFIIENKTHGLFCALWAVVLIVPLIPFPTPLVLSGFSWKPELTVSFLILSFLIFNLFRNKKNPFPAFGGKSLWIVAPLAAFILWSASSVFWAESLSGVTHHTLAWACYLIFFLVFVQIAADRKFLTLSFFSLGAAMAIISTLCIVEFTFSAQINETYGFRFGRYAEMSAVVFPLFFSFLLRLKGKHFLVASLTAVCIWLTILFSLSRGALMAAIAGFFVFLALRIISKTGFGEKKNLITASAALVLFTFFVQFFIPINSISKFGNAGDNDENSISYNIRHLFYGTALEMLRDNPVIGVGADNFALKFDDYRVGFSRRAENEQIARQGENALPERAHNEYLQILSELGIIGGIIFLILIIGILKLSFANFKRNNSRRSGIFEHAAFAGLCAFAISSLFSSFSFRLMQNGVVFFFLLAVLMRDYFGENPVEKSSVPQISVPRRRIAFASAVAVCSALSVFSVLIASSQYLVYRAERTEDFQTAESLFKTAERLTPSSVAPNYSFALRLMKEQNFKESTVEFQKAINKGLYTSVMYSRLTTAHLLAGQLTEAEKTLLRAREIYPYSVFVKARYASVLQKLGKTREAEQELAFAKSLNKQQAETWSSLIESGATRTSESAKRNPDILPLMKLNPQDALYAVLDERYITNPEEIPQFSFLKQ